MLGNQPGLYCPRIERVSFLDLGHSNWLIFRITERMKIDNPLFDPEIKKKHLIWQAVAGIAAGLGILSRNLALDTTRVAIVIGLLQISALFTLILAPIILGKEEKEQITLKLVFGVLLIIGGSLLIIYGRNL